MALVRAPHQTGGQSVLRTYWLSSQSSSHFFKSIGIAGSHNAVPLLTTVKGRLDRSEPVRQCSKDLEANTHALQSMLCLVLRKAIFDSDLHHVGVPPSSSSQATESRSGAGNPTAWMYISRPFILFHHSSCSSYLLSLPPNLRTPQIKRTQPPHKSKLHNIGVHEEELHAPAPLAAGDRLHARVSWRGVGRQEDVFE